MHKRLKLYCSGIGCSTNCKKQIIFTLGSGKIPYVDICFQIGEGVVIQGKDFNKLLGFLMSKKLENE